MSSLDAAPIDPPLTIRESPRALRIIMPTSSSMTHPFQNFVPALIANANKCFPDPATRPQIVALLQALSAKTPSAV